MPLAQGPRPRLCSLDTEPVSAILASLTPANLDVPKSNSSWICSVDRPVTGFIHLSAEFLVFFLTVYKFLI